MTVIIVGIVVLALMIVPIRKMMSGVSQDGAAPAG